LTLLTTLSLATARADDSADRRFVAGLRERRLYSLAEKFCVERMNVSGLSDQRQADLAVDLSACYAEHAAESVGPPAEALWQRGLDACLAFLKNEPTSPRLVLVRVQLALVRIEHGEAMLAEQQASESEVGMEQARTLLRNGIRQLREARKDVDEQARNQRLGQANGPGVLTADELANLGRTIDYQLGRALLRQATSYPSGSPDRAAAIEQALELLKPLAQSEVNDALGWQSRLARIEAHLAASDFDEAEKQLSALGTVDVPPAIAPLVAAERLRLAVAQGKKLDDLKLPDDQELPSLAYDEALFDACLAASRAAHEAKRTDDARRYETMAGQLVERIERLYGATKARGVETRLATQASSAADLGDDANLLRAAEGLYRAGRLDEAVAAYDRVVQAARRDRQPGREFAAAFAAAAIRQRQQNYADALARFEQLARALPEHPKASQAHLMAAFDAAQLVAAGKNEQAEHYATLLREHVRLWPHAPTADQARLWLARLAARAAHWSEAADALRAIGPESLAHVEAVEALGRVYQGWIIQERAAGQPTDELSGKALDYFGQIVGADPAASQVTLTAPERAALLGEARVRLALEPTQAAKAEQAVRRALAAAGDASAPWKASTEALLCQALAAQGRFAEANEALERSSGPQQSRFELTESLTRLAAESASDAAGSLVDLALRAASGLDGSKLSAAQRRDLTLLLAEALFRARRFDDARGRLEALCREYPKDVDAQEAYARLLAESDAADAWPAALERWRALEQAARPGTERWFRAKFYLALVHDRLGNHERAAQIIELTQLLHPELGGPEMKERFEKLLEQCRAAVKP